MWKILYKLATDNYCSSTGYIADFIVDDKLRRSPDVNKWYSALDRGSRDQYIPLLIWLGLSDSSYHSDILRGLFKSHLKRGLLFTTNTRKNFVYPTLEEHQVKSTPDVPWDYKEKMPDLTGPEYWALYIRGFKLWYLYPLLCLLDLETFLSSVALLLQPKKEDVVNHAVVLEYAKVRMPTPFSVLAKCLNPRFFLRKKLDKFFGKEIEPPINELYRKL